MNHAHQAAQPSATRQALDATRHCLIGRAVGLTLAADTISGHALAHGAHG